MCVCVCMCVPDRIWRRVLNAVYMHGCALHITVSVYRSKGKHIYNTDKYIYRDDFSNIIDCFGLAYGLFSSLCIFRFL